MSTPTKIAVIAGAAAAAVITGFLFATPKGNEIRKKIMDKMLSNNGRCHDEKAQA